ncbi:MAG TPA: copper resistance CopC family protein [Usitatibacter sp.]|nr:copper resistance CopC family protein [Usitatibacter sp.]
MKRAIVGLALALLPPAAFAHAFLEHAEPRVGSKVDHAPGEVTLRFSESLEPAFSTVEVLDAAGHRVDRNDRKVDPKDAAVMRVSVPPLGPGKYRVKWRALSADTHVTQGDFTFEVGR